MFNGRCPEYLGDISTRQSRHEKRNSEVPEILRRKTEGGSYCGERVE